jgi:hypothetical protein
MIIQQLHDHRVVLVNQDSFYRGLTPEESARVSEYNFDHPGRHSTVTFTDPYLSSNKLFKSKHLLQNHLGTLLVRHHLSIFLRGTFSVSKMIILISLGVLYFGTY